MLTRTFFILEFDKGYAPQRHEVQFRADKKRMVKGTVFALLFIPIVDLKSGLVSALMVKLKIFL